MKESFNRNLFIFFLIIFSGFTIIGVLGYETNQALVDTSKLVDHTQEVLKLSDKVLSTAQGIGSTGYVLTGDSAYLEQFIRSEKSIDQYLAQLKFLTIDNPVQQSRIDSIGFYVHKRIDLAHRSIKMQNEENKKVELIIASTKEGKYLMDNIRKQIHDIQNDENLLLQRRKEANNSNINAMNRFSVTAFVILFFMLVIVFLTIAYSFRRQLEFEKKISLINADLELRVIQRTEELHRSERRFRALIENSNDVICLMDGGGEIMYMSPAVERVTGFTELEMKGIPGFDFIHPDDREEAMEFYTNIMSQPGVATYKQHRIKHKDGRWLWTEGTVINLLHDESVKAVVANFRDISERREAEFKLETNERRFRALIERSQNGIVLTNAEGTLTYLSPSTKYLTGYENEELLGLHITQVYHKEDVDSVKESYREVLTAPGKVVYVQCRVVHKGGMVRWMEGTRTNLLNDPAVEAIVTNFRDITDRKMVEEEKRKLNQQLEKRVKQRTSELEAVNNDLKAFTYSVSHDLRTPLRAISGFSMQLVKHYESQIDENGVRMLKIVSDNAIKMGQLIDDLLTYSRIGYSNLDLSEVEIMFFAQNVIDELKAANPVLPVRFILGEPQRLVCDKVLMKQVLMNMIGNAVKFSNKSFEPIVTIGSYTENGNCVFYVKDNGAGFDMRYADKLFGVFQRLHKMNEFEGTGVGLAIVHRIIQKHDGKVWAEGKLGEGATFYFSIPAQIAV